MKIITIVYLTTLLMCPSFCSAQKKIIVLNGTTTSGKTTTAQALKDYLESRQKDAVIFSIDTFFIPKLLKTFACTCLGNFSISTDLITKELVDETKNESHQELLQAAKEAYDHGKIVIIDTVIRNAKELSFYQDGLQEYPTFFSILYCPLDVLAQRVIERNQNSGITEQRSIAQALNQFSCIYKKCSDNCINKIDICTKETVEVTCDNASQEHERIQQIIPTYLKALQDVICPYPISDIKDKLLLQFDLDIKQQSTLEPFFVYNCCINTSKYRPKSCAIVIAEQALKQSVWDFGDDTLGEYEAM